jgi:hypothetical protein
MSGLSHGDFSSHSTSEDDDDDDSKSLKVDLKKYLNYVLCQHCHESTRKKH